MVSADGNGDERDIRNGQIGDFSVLPLSDGNNWKGTIRMANRSS
jgi:hypothetical protein